MTEAGKKYDSIVLGLGVTGRSAIDFLLGEGESIAAFDSRLGPGEVTGLQKKYPGLPVYLGEFDPVMLSAARRIIVSPGISLKQPAIQAAQAAGVEISSDLEIFCQRAASPIIAVTGSNGKSTVVSLLTRMIRENEMRVELAGNIGTPVLDLLKTEKPDYYVLELSSFQLETLRSLDALAAVVLNVSPDHMDRYADIAEYAGSKQRIYRGTGTVILNLDDEIVAQMALAGRRAVTFGINTGNKGNFHLLEEGSEYYLALEAERLLPVSSLKLQGRHNVANVLACLALGYSIGLPINAMLAAAKSYEGLPHRCQWIACVNGVDWYNDSKATNVGATCAAIEGLSHKGPLILIAGGDGKKADFSPLAGTISAHVKSVILTGKDANIIERSLAVDTQRLFATSMDSAVQSAARIAEPGDLVLLSPACASQDMYRDYQHRGEVFSAAVKGLAGGSR